MRCLLLTFVATVTPAMADPVKKPVTATEARGMIGKEVTVTLVVRTVKDRLEKRGEIYLDSEENFKDEKNFALVITRQGAESLKAQGVTDVADHFKDKSVTATGTVKEVDGVPRIEIDDARQIKLDKK